MNQTYIKFAICVCLVLGSNQRLLAQDNSNQGKAGAFNVQVDVEPQAPKVGKNRIEIKVRDADENPVSGASLKAVAVMPAMGSMPAMYAPAELSETNPGTYVGSFEPSMGGEWPLTIDISTGNESASITFDLATGRKGLRCTTCGNASEEIPGTVRVDPARRQLIGITTGRVKRKTLRVTIRATGVVTYDETRLSDVALKFGGWVGELFADSVGRPVKKGEPLFTIYSPELLAAQEEYLETMRRFNGDLKAGKQRIDAARRRLRLWDLGDAHINALENRGQAQEYVPILAPRDGVIVEKTIVAGSAFSAGQKLLRIADLSRVWVEAQVYDYELPLITAGMKADVQLTNLENRSFKGKVDYIYPTMQSETRTARVRVTLDNSRGVLRPDMYAQVRLKADLGKRLMVAESAVLFTGDSRVVFVDIGEGRLVPRKVNIGQSNRDYIEILDGLEEGETVVTSGNFLIAAESKLKAGVEQW